MQQIGSRSSNNEADRRRERPEPEGRSSRMKLRKERILFRKNAVAQQTTAQLPPPYFRPLIPDPCCSWAVKKLDLERREKVANRVRNRKDPEADPNGADVPGNVVTDIVVVLMFDFRGGVFWGGHWIWDLEDWDSTV